MLQRKLASSAICLVLLALAACADKHASNPRTEAPLVRSGFVQDATTALRFHRHRGCPCPERPRLPGFGEGTAATHSVFWGTLAYTLIGGTFAGTVLILVFLPAMYAIRFRITRPEGTTAGVENAPATAV